MRGKGTEEAAKWLPNSAETEDEETEKLRSLRTGANYANSPWGKSLI